MKRRTVAIMLERDSGEMFQVVYPGEQTMGCKFVCSWFVGEDAACCAAQCPLSDGSHDKFCLEFSARDVFMSPEKLAFCSGRENTISFWFHFGLSCQEPWS